MSNVEKYAKMLSVLLSCKTNEQILTWLQWCDRVQISDEFRRKFESDAKYFHIDLMKKSVGVPADVTL